MRKILYCIILLTLNCSLSAGNIEEKGYYTSPKSVINGIIYSDNYCSKLYYNTGENEVELLSSPG